MSIKDADGQIAELRCTYDPATRGGDAPDGRKVKATLHWVSAAHALDVEVRLYDRLFKSELPEAVDYLADLNPVSLDVLTGARSSRACWMPRPARATSSNGSDTSASIPTPRPGSSSSTERSR